MYNPFYRVTLCC